MVAAGSAGTDSDGAAVMVMLAVADFVLSAAEVAVTVPDPIEPLAVKVAEVLVWPDSEPPVWLQVTPLDDESLATDAVKLSFCS